VGGGAKKNKKGINIFSKKGFLRGGHTVAKGGDPQNFLARLRAQFVPPPHLKKALVRSCSHPSRLKSIKHVDILNKFLSAKPRRLLMEERVFTVLFLKKRLILKLNIF
jgi:hypothetical protein